MFSGIFEGMPSEELFVFGFGCAVILWCIYRIFTSGKYGSSILYWLLAIISGVSLYLWRSGIGLEWYSYIKTALITPY